MAGPTAVDTIRFLFYPDFSKIGFSSLIHAIGHVCFTLGLGLGTMMTFGSYLRESTHLATAGYRVTFFDTIISLMAGLLIFPIVLSVSSTTTSGPEVLFEALPRLFIRMEGGWLFGCLFFLCLYIAALGASIGLMETLTGNWMEGRSKGRVEAVRAIGILVFVISFIPAFGPSLLQGAVTKGRDLLEIIDGILINGFLPIVVLCISILVGFRLKRELSKKEFVNDDSVETQVLYGHWTIGIRYLIPGTITLAILLGIIGFFVR